MTIKVCTAETWQRRCIEGMDRAARDILVYGGAPSRVRWALATFYRNVRTLTRRSGRALSVTISGAEAEALGLKAGARVVSGINERGNLEFALATERDLPGFIERLAEAGYLQPVPPLPPRNFKGYDRVCRDCGLRLHSTGSNRWYCDGCGRKRQREAHRRYNNLNRKMTPRLPRKAEQRCRSSAQLETIPL